ncbi:hypothetical protein KW823_21300 [Enterobacter quasiroggenkampii]|nr:hypothetical protein [Enterobacter quasiroggenkampii]
MDLPKLARRFAKTIFFIALSFPVGRTLGPAEFWFDYELAHRIGEVFYGPGEIGQDALYEVYTYIGLITILLITTALYVLIMKLINKIRKK